MAKDTRLSTLVVNAQAEALAKLADGGWIDIYDGDRPASVDEPVKGQKLGVSLRLGSPAFIPAEDGILTANPITVGRSVAEIRATWARITRADHKTALMDQSVGREGSKANIELPNTKIVEGITVSVSSFTHTVPKRSDRN